MEIAGHALTRWIAAAFVEMTAGEVWQLTGAPLPVNSNTVGRPRDHTKADHSRQCFILCIYTYIQGLADRNLNTGSAKYSHWQRRTDRQLTYYNAGQVRIFGGSSQNVQNQFGKNIPVVAKTWALSAAQRKTHRHLLQCTLDKRHPVKCYGRSIGKNTIYSRRFRRNATENSNAMSVVGSYSALVSALQVPNHDKQLVFIQSQVHVMG